MADYDRTYLEAANAKRFSAAAKMSAAPLRRQLRSAKRILDVLLGSEGAQGMLLADDAGLGKTTIGAITAWVAASEGSGRSVRILAPNVVVAQRWDDELRRTLPALQDIAEGKLRLSGSSIGGYSPKASARHIQVTTQSRAVARGGLSCSLLIVDEAHRSKADTSDYRKAVGEVVRKGTKVLMLTATPMSLKAEELASMLALLGRKEAAASIRDFGKQIQFLYAGGDSRSEEQMAADLCSAADRATADMAACVLRHSVDNLSKVEQRAFGNGKVPWIIKEPSASSAEIELLARIDRLIRLAHPSSVRSNDPQFHVARAPVRQALENALSALATRKHAAFGTLHADAINKLRILEQPHPKMLAVADAIVSIVQESEKVAVFCHHHLVAEELTRVLARQVPAHPESKHPYKIWHSVWSELLGQAEDPYPNTGNRRILRRTFIDWICTKSFRDQIGSWIAARPPLTPDVLKKTYIPGGKPGGKQISIADAMVKLMSEVLNPKSKSMTGTLRLRAGNAADVKPLPFGATVATRVIGACESRIAAADGCADGHLFLQERRPDLLIALFNSPFGPDVVVLTDRYSEGIDLHVRCRYLLHYELDPSPVRTIQREGRIRRVNCWASVHRSPVKCAMPAFLGTRDERMVRIMEERIRSFGLLLGGGPSGLEDNRPSSLDDRVRRVLSLSEKKLQKFNGRLCLDGK